MGLRQDILEEKVRELHLREVLILHDTDTVRQAVRLMRERRLGCVVVLGADGAIAGDFTERSLKSLLLNDPADLDAPLREHLSTQWASVKLDDPITAVVDVMESLQLRFVVVVDDDGKAVGLTGQKSIVEHVVDHFPREVKVQTMASKLHMDQREGG